MDWAREIYQLEEFTLSSFSDPPYALLWIGLFILLSSGVAFLVTLRLRAEDWASDRSPSHVSRWGRLQLSFPFAGVILGLGMFLASGLEIFGLPTFLSCAVAGLVTLLVASLVWSRLGKALGQRMVDSYLSKFPEFPGHS